MSELKVEIVKVDGIEPHPNADRLDVAYIKGWTCVVRRGDFKAGQKAVYFPIDSILPEKIESKIFPPDSKVKLSKSRIKTIKLRGVISQGLLVSLDELDDFINANNRPLGRDLTVALDVTKYEPKTINVRLRGRRATRKETNPYFMKYTDIQNYKNYPNSFKEGDDVVVTEKIHGTNFRAGWVPIVVDTTWKKVKKFFGKLDKFEFVVGSHNVQLSGETKKLVYYDTNVYVEAVKKYNLKSIIPKDVVVYGEIYGSGIQKGYNYGCVEGERKLVVFDVKHIGQYVPHLEIVDYCVGLGLDMVPVVYVGSYIKEKVEEWVNGPSLLGGQKIREGVVIKSSTEKQSLHGRKILKRVNDKYLLKEQTDFH